MDKTTAKSKVEKRKQGADMFTDEEKAAMKAHVKELKAARSGRRASREDGEKEVREAIAAMPQPGRSIAERLHSLVTASAPSLIPRTWYGMPAYANEEGKVICFFRGKEKFKERYMTFGFNQEARLDEGNLWPIVYALTDLTPAEEKRIVELVKQAVS